MAKHDDIDFELDERLASVQNIIALGRLAVLNCREELIPTALETAFEQLQSLVDEFCVEE